jgi:hypothetical protein
LAKHLDAANQDLIRSSQLVQALKDKCAKKIASPDLVDKLVNYVNLTQSQEVNVVLFVAALRVVELDFKTYDLNELLT